jgi:hypothetical protein
MGISRVFPRYTENLGTTKEIIHENAPEVIETISYCPHLPSVYNHPGIPLHKLL